ncbi:hypothetical protein GCM10027570_23180 [Streptomonospora sediminis]
MLRQRGPVPETARRAGTRSRGRNKRNDQSYRGNRSENPVSTGANTHTDSHAVAGPGLSPGDSGIDPTGHRRAGVNRQAAGELSFSNVAVGGSSCFNAAHRREVPADRTRPPHTTAASD